MPINFPNGPVSGQLYTYDSKTWEYNGIYWEVYSALTSYVAGITAGSGISASTTNNVTTITNTGVTGITAGTNISINQSTGNVTIDSTGGGVSLGTVYTTSNNFNFL